MELEPLVEPLRPSTPLGSEPERTRRTRDTLQFTRESMAPQSIVEDSLVQPMMMELEASVVGLEDIQLQRESLLTKTSPDMEEAAWVDSEMDKLYRFSIWIMVRFGKKIGALFQRNSGQTVGVDKRASVRVLR